jgi:N-glycosylase/DNA lyase
MRRRLEGAVLRLCPFIEKQVATSKKHFWTEYDLRRELVACILGSQVRHEMVITALKHLESSHLLNDDLWSNPQSTFESKVFNVLSGRTLKTKNEWSYRFPKVRAKQLAKARDEIEKRSLSERISDFADPKLLRKQLVKDIPGLGPKQASMFLRNVGKSFELAILDTHVLRFMDLKNLVSLKHKNIGTVKAYERTEKIVVNYADEKGYPVGYIDWAIWATMQAASEISI